jgi:hypothetical protein
MNKSQTQFDELRENEVSKFTRKLDLTKSADRLKKFQLERDFAQRHQTPDRFVFDCDVFQPSKSL